MSVDEPVTINLKQKATNAQSASARLDRETETKIYRLFQAYFRRAEEERRWVVWSDVPWDTMAPSPSAELVEAVYSVYLEDSFLPDYSARAIQVERSSRGRTWFLTRWSYEEGKHLLALNEWLVRSGAYTNEQLRDDIDAQLRAYRWEPPFTEGIAVIVDALVWEIREIERYRAIRSLAEKENEPALVDLMGRILEDEEDHREFFRATLRIIGERHAEQLQEAVERIAHVQEDPHLTVALYRTLDMTPSAS